MTQTQTQYTRHWRLASYLLLGAWVGCAILVMNRVRGGFLTSYGADLTQPAWLYIVCRGLAGPTKGNLVKQTIGSSPETATLVIFLAGVVTEVSQYYWPQGIFRGRFDPFDIVAYATGIGLCYVIDKRCAAHSTDDNLPA